MHRHLNSYNNHYTRAKTRAESQQLAERMANIEFRLNQLLETLSRQQQFYQQIQQSYLKRSSQQPYEQSEPINTNPDQPEPGIPSEKHKLPEKPRRVFIPAGKNGVVRM